MYFGRLTNYPSSLKEIQAGSADCWKEGVGNGNHVHC